jgi:hypothetical protein
MKYIQLTTRQGAKITIFIGNGNIAVFEDPTGKVSVMDGLHNNGGWQVFESYETVITMIQAA